jgi:Fuc2NAc and GlcNAc transferase
MSVQSVAAILVAMFVTWFFLFLLVPLLAIHFPDAPNLRSSHRLTTPRAGGLAFVIVAAFAALLFSPLPTSPARFIILSLPLAIVGFLDDRHQVPASLRFVAQFATALFVVLLSPLVSPSLRLLPLLLILVISVTAVINFTNFMDGLDGMVAGCMVIAIGVSAIKLAAPWPIWSLVGALLGFLVWNWSPAKVFMGDVGSTFLGAIFAVLVLQSSTWPDALALMLLATPLLADALFCVPRRLLSGQRVFQPHRLHLFQRLHQAGWSHARVSSLYIAATSVLAITLLFAGLPWVIALALIELLFGIWLDQQVAVPFAVASRS